MRPSFWAKIYSFMLTVGSVGMVVWLIGLMLRWL